MLLSRRLLSKTVPVYPMPEFVEDGRLLLSKATSVHTVLLHVVLFGQLLPKAVSAVLLVC